MDPTLKVHTLDVGPFGFMDYGSSGANGTAQPKPDPNTAHIKLNWARSSLLQTLNGIDLGLAWALVFLEPGPS